MNTPALELHIEYLPTATLQPDPKNPRKHSKKQIKTLARAIEEFGFNCPILIDKSNTIIAGACRLEAARLLTMPQVPIIRLEHLNEAQIRAYRIADNKIAELAEWDEEALRLELQSLSDLNIDLTITGFEIPELDMILNPINSAEEEDAIPPSDGPPVTKLGDIFILGPHRIICGNALEPETYERLMTQDKADLIFTDPPYNVPTRGHILRENKHGHPDFAMAAGEMTDQQFESFLSTAINMMQKHSTDRSIHYLCMDWRHIAHLLAAGRSYQELKNICIWNKKNGGLGSFYRSKHEMIAVFKNGTEPHINNIELGKHGRYRTNVWDYAGQTSIGKKQSEELAMHPTVKPVEMIADAILDSSDRNHIVLDPFGGSGSTLIAAEKTHRHARLMELEPKYVDVTIRRWQKLTGGKATLASTGQTFDEVETARKGEAV